MLLLKQLVPTLLEWCPTFWEHQAYTLRLMRQLLRQNRLTSSNSESSKFAGLLVAVDIYSDPKHFAQRDMRAMPVTKDLNRMHLDKERFQLDAHTSQSLVANQCCSQCAGLSQWLRRESACVASLRVVQIDALHFANVPATYHCRACSLLQSLPCACPCLQLHPTTASRVVPMLPSEPEPCRPMPLQCRNILFAMQSAPVAASEVERRAVCSPTRLRRNGAPMRNMGILPETQALIVCGTSQATAMLTATSVTVPEGGRFTLAAAAQRHPTPEQSSGHALRLVVLRLPLASSRLRQELHYQRTNVVVSNRTPRQSSCRIPKVRLP